MQQLSGMKDPAPIRPLTPADFEAYCCLLDDLVGASQVLRGAAGHAVFLHMLAEPATTLLTAEQNGQPASVLTLHLHSNLTRLGRPYAVIENVVTLAPMRGLGLGRRVMEAAIAKAWAAGAYKIMLSTGRGRGAKGFYEALGFSDQDKHAMILRRD